MKKLLAVDGNIKNFNRHNDTWQKHGIEPVRVSSMHEAIEKLVNEEFIIIGINGDSINYMPLLSIMHDTTLAPICIFVARYSFEEHITAIQNGADYYMQRQPDSEEITRWNIVMLQRYLERNTRLKQSHKVLCYKNVFVCPHYRKAFINDAEIHLTRREFDLLSYLIANPKRVYTYNQILRRVWGDEYVDGNNIALRSVISRLRKKLKITPDMPEYIRNVHDLGYTFD